MALARQDGAGDAADGLDAVGVGGAVALGDDVGPQGVAHVGGIQGVHRLAGDGQIGFGREEHTEAEALQGLVMDDEYGGHGGPPS